MSIMCLCLWPVRMVAAAEVNHFLLWKYHHMSTWCTQESFSNLTILSGRYSFQVLFLHLVVNGCVEYNFLKIH